MLWLPGLPPRLVLALRRLAKELELPVKLMEPEQLAQAMQRRQAVWSLLQVQAPPVSKERLRLVRRIPW